LGRFGRGVFGGGFPQSARDGRLAKNIAKAGRKNHPRQYRARPVIAGDDCARIVALKPMR
jgi:hypothetical protein